MSGLDDMIGALVFEPDPPIPMIGGPADGETLRRSMVSRNGILRSGVEWEVPPVRAVSDPDSFTMVGSRALYLHTVAVRRDPHPCVRGLEMIAEWDAYVWDRVNPDSIKVTDQHALGPPSRFRVQVTDPIRYAPVVPTSNEPIRYSHHSTGTAVDIRADLEAVRDRWREVDRRYRRGEIGP